MHAHYIAVGVCIRDFMETSFRETNLKAEFAFALCVTVYKKKNKQFEKLSTKPTVQWVISLLFFFKYTTSACTTQVVLNRKKIQA